MNATYAKRIAEKSLKRFTKSSRVEEMWTEIRLAALKGRHSCVIRNLLPWQVQVLTNHLQIFGYEFCVITFEHKTNRKEIKIKW